MVLSLYYIKHKNFKVNIVLGIMDYIILTNTFQRPPELVERSIKSSLNQKIKPQKVILIDQNEPPLQLSQELIKNSLFEIQYVNTASVSIARNSARKPPCDWYVYCDDDGYMNDDYSEVLEKVLSTNNYLDIVAGSIVRDDNFEFYSPRHAIGGNLNNFRFTKLLMGSNFAVKEKVFHDLGSFDEEFGIGGKWGSGEETDFAWKAYFNKIPMLYEKDLIVYHIKPYAGDLKHSMKKAFTYGVGKGALICKWLRKGKLIILYELLEMEIIPLWLILKAILMINFREVLISLASLAGRNLGILKFLFGK
jgi:hypothetical protein